MLPLESQELVPETPYIWRAKRPEPTHRLICFPHAGAGAAAYAEWVGLLPPEIELVAVQLPGRQNRIAEDPFTEVAPLVAVLGQALRPVFDGPFSFFGHSGGASLAYELTKALRARGSRGPEQLFLSAQPAPGESGLRQLHDLSDEDLAAEIVALGGLDPEIAEDEDVMESLLFTLRADFALWERHESASDTPLDIPITALTGKSDPRAPLEHVERWRDFTTAPFETELYPGGHFYFLEEPSEVVSVISRRILNPATSGRTA
ncbi:thioesterase II family protein [Streptomyces venezuelae]|uniref:thioesterase II family protein n=1 Tax=Streptomyces venezuelae TaxID=54571 RepID=UPI001CC24FA9|nr:alpha/beta fold hydrolase [Streptomyces venezuelae]